MSSGLKFYFFIVVGIFALIIIAGIVNWVIKSERTQKVFSCVTDFLRDIQF